MRLVDPEHGRAGADQRIEGEDRLVGVLGRHAPHHVDLCADGQHRPGRGLFDPGQDPLGGPHLVGQGHDLVGALRVHDHGHAGVLGPGGGHVRRLEPLVHRAVALPQQESGVLDLPVLQAALLEPGVPHHHLRGRIAHGQGGVAINGAVLESRRMPR